MAGQGLAYGQPSLFEQEEASPRRILRSLSEAAVILRTPEATLRYWRHLGTGPRSFKIGRRVMYDENDLYQWINQQRDGGRN